MNFPDIRTILEIPFVYSMFQRIVRGDGDHLFVSRYARPQKHDKVLDIGCGPADILPYFPEVEYLGFDVDPRLIKTAKERHGERGTFVCAKVSEDAVPQEGEFDIVIATGVLHHLPDEDALALFRLAQKALKPEGRLVTWDCGFVDGQSAFSRFLVSRDRGDFVRSTQEYVELAERVFSRVKWTVDHDLVRLPYPSVMLECSSL